MSRPGPAERSVAWPWLRARLPPPLVDAVVRRPGLHACLRAGLLVAVFVVVDRAILRAASLPVASHFEPVLTVELMRRLGWWPGLAAVLLVAVLARFGALACGWQALGGRGLRSFIVFLAAVLTWFAVTRGYNFYFDQAHWYDRALLLVLLVALWWRPVWVLPLSLLLAALLVQQAAPPLGASILAHKLQVLHVLHLFGAAVLVHALSGRTRPADFVFVTCCLVAGSYFTAALAKIDLHWWAHDQLYLLPPSAFAHGWLDFLGADGIAAIAAWLRPFDAPMRWAVLVIEAGCLLFLAHRRVTVTLLVAVVVFHCGVLALYGFFFWTWMLLDLALLALLLRGGEPMQPVADGRPVRMFSVVLIATAALWSRPPWLGWLDTGLTYTYRFEAVTESGRRYTLRPEYFAPYEDVFTMTPFSYVVQGHRVLTSSYGVTKSADIARALAATRAADDVPALERRLGVDAFNAANAERLLEFVTRYVATRNAYAERPASLAVLGPPPQFISHRPGVRDTDGEAIAELIAVEVTTWFDGRAPAPIRIEEVARVAFDGGGPRAARAQSTNRSSAPGAETRQ